jgi:hypothetical protein
LLRPAIENHSPYIEAVFGSITELNNNHKQRILKKRLQTEVPRLEPLVAAFTVN